MHVVRILSKHNLDTSHRALVSVNTDNQRREFRARSGLAHEWHGRVLEGREAGGMLMAGPERLWPVHMQLRCSSECEGKPTAWDGQLAQITGRKLIPPSIHLNKPGLAKHTFLNTQPFISLLAINAANRLNTCHVSNYTHTHTRYHKYPAGRNNHRAHLKKKAAKDQSCPYYFIPYFIIQVHDNRFEDFSNIQCLKSAIRCRTHTCTRHTPRCD